MANQSRGLVTQTAGDGNTLERAHDDIAKGFVIGGRRDLGQVNLITVDFEEIQEFIVILVGVQIHEHGTGGVCHVGGVDIVKCATVEVIDQPGVDGAKGQGTIFIGVANIGVVSQQPHQGNG